MFSTLYATSATAPGDLTNFVPTGLVPLPEVQIDGPITCTQVGELEVCST